MQLATDATAQQACPSTEPTTFALIVARHAERIDWVFFYARHFSLSAFIYNDGRAMKAWANVPLALPPRVHVLRVPRQGNECYKYLRFIIDCHDSLAGVHEWVVFTQGYPFDHSPDFAGLMHSTRHWSRPVQVLSYYGHPAPWGPASLWNDSLRVDQWVNGNRVWCSPMSDDLQASEWHDPWLATTAPALGRAEFPIPLSVWWRRNNVTLPLPPIDRVCKMFGSIFAVEPSALRAHPLSFWQQVMRTHATSNGCLQLESMWQPLLVAAGESTPAGGRRSGTGARRRTRTLTLRLRR